MKKIINLILLQFETIFALKKYMALMIGMAVFIAITQPNMLPFAGALFIMATCYSTAFYEEKSKVNYLVYSLPIKTSEYIVSRYIFIAINTLISMGLSAVLYFVMTNFNIISSEETFPLWSLMLILAGIGIFMMTLLIPMELLLGFEKARIALVFLTVFPIVFSTELVNLLPQIDISSNIVIILIVFIVFTLVLASYFITSNLFDKKEV